MSKIIRIPYELLVEVEEKGSGQEPDFTIQSQLHDIEDFVAECIANGDYIEDCPHPGPFSQHVGMITCSRCGEQLR